MEIKEIEKRIKELHEILIGARTKIVNDFKGDNPKWDNFITSEISKRGHGGNVKDMPLPYIYAFEILMAPIGYLNALSKDEFNHEILESYRISNILEEDTGKTAIKIFDSLWEDHLLDILSRCLYDNLTPFPYGNAGNYDSMTWAFGFAVDALDLFKSGTNKYYSQIIFTLQDFLMDFFEPKEICVKNKEKPDLIGYYFSPKIFDRIRREIRLIKNPSSLIKKFKESIESRLVFALSNSSALATYNIVRDVIRDIEEIRGSYDLAGKNLSKLAESIRVDILKFKEIKNPDDFKEVYYHIFNFGILISISDLEGYSSVIKDNQDYLKKIIEIFIGKFNENEEFKKTLELEIPEIGNQKNDLIFKEKFEINIAYPILIRSLVTLLKVVRKKKIEINVKEFEENLGKSIEMFIKEYMSDETGIFRIPGENNYDLALTNSAVEALTLSLGYYLELWKDKGGGKNKIEVSRQKFEEFEAWKQSKEQGEFEGFETWKAFKIQLLDEFDKRIDSRLKRYSPLKADTTIEAIIEEKVKNHKTGDSKYNDRILALNKFLEIFEGLKNIKEDDNQLLKKIWSIVLECTKSLGTNDYDKLEKRAQDAIKIYYNPQGGQNRKKLIGDEFTEVEKLKAGKKETSKKDPV